MPNPDRHLPHRRKNALTGEWVLVSPQRTNRPWQGEEEPAAEKNIPAYDPNCYLCPGNTRANGEKNPHYESTFVFTNDFPALIGNSPASANSHTDLLTSRPELGMCRVVNFSPRHDLSLSALTEKEIVVVIETLQREMRSLMADKRIRHAQIFENRGAAMGNSNPHPHCQIWGQESIPTESQKELTQQRKYRAKTGRTLLGDYLKLELRRKERIVYENDAFAILVPFWAVWPFETMVLPRKRRSTIVEFTPSEVAGFADALKTLTRSYDALFQSPFPYSAGIHQSPNDGKRHPEFFLHMHFYPPLLRSASVRKFMVGYELLSEPQRDLTPEEAAGRLRAVVHQLGK